MKSAIYVFVLVIIAFGANFQSKYINLTNNWIEDQIDDDYGGDTPSRCQLFGEYYLSETYSAVATYRDLCSKSDLNYGQSLSYSSLEGHHPVGYGDVLEVRYSGATPFAVILRAFSSNYDGESETEQGEALVVVGLRGFEEISEYVDVKKTKNANLRARVIADSLYLRKK